MFNFYGDNSNGKMKSEKKKIFTFTFAKFLTILYKTVKNSFGCNEFLMLHEIKKHEICNNFFTNEKKQTPN